MGMKVSTPSAETEQHVSVLFQVRREYVEGEKGSDGWKRWRS